MLDLHVIPRYKGCRKVGKEQGGVEGEHRKPLISESHEYRRSATNVRFIMLEI